ncbi:MAG: 7-carboxy-7-deazaguanine synthase [Thiotrichales bacterium]|jgi:7-carboxy-7-deazaguanine synthase (Cx14CxxC type)|nr:7-carboxy-7-deazaguanine synthase [Thiotrichales bacterium]
MAYTVKEIFYTLQGEGQHTGRAAIFCRFTGCNLWNGLSSGREIATCKFCDTDFIGTDGALGGKYNAEQLAQTIASLWPSQSGITPFCVLTGGEPAMQFDEALKTALHALHIEIAMETNGTVALKAQPDWLCVSPKADTKLVVTTGDELKLVWPQPMHPVNPEDFAALNFKHFYLQPIDGLAKNYAPDCVAYCKQHPQWKLSLQTHKILGIE